MNCLRVCVCARRRQAAKLAKDPLFAKVAGYKKSTAPRTTGASSLSVDGREKEAPGTEFSRIGMV